MEDKLNIPKGWKITTLGNVTNIRRGASPRPIHDYLTNHGLPWIKISDVSSLTSRFISNTRQYIKKEGESNTVLVNKGDLILSNSATPGIPKFVNIRAGIHDGWLLIENKGIDKLFLYYLLLISKPKLVQVADGAVFKNLKTELVRDLRICIPDNENEQRKIASILSSLDFKIELLHEQSKTLELIAQTIFNEWFINFNFPDESGKPYKLNGGRMLNSELGKIPKDWNIESIGNYINIRGGTTPSTKISEYWNGNIAWTSPKDLSNFKSIYLLDTEKKITKNGLNCISSGLLPKGTLLLSSRAPIGYIAFSNLELAINQGYIAFLPDQYLSNYYMFLWLKANMYKVISVSNGSTFLEISKSSFKNIKSIIPPQKILKHFDAQIIPIFKKILLNQQESKILSDYRNLLLPPLMKGQIRIER